MKTVQPTFGDLLAAYPEIAALERLKSERPCETRVWNVLCGVRRVLDVLGLGDGAPIGDLTRHRVDTFLARTIASGVAPVSAWSYVLGLRGIVARWTLPYYEARGWKVRPFDLPEFRRRSKRYVRPGREVLAKVKGWYDGLSVEADKRKWLAATLMLEFAMRNGDVGRLRWSDFREREDTVSLCYTPRKTSLSSGRVVSWPVHPGIWSAFCRIRDAAPDRSGTHFAGLVVPAAKEVFRALNGELRARRLFTGSKGCYELRKICVDHVYQKFGAEMASSISGDDIRTVTRYYADPSAVNFTGVRIVDLIA